MVYNEAAILRSVRWISGQGLPTRESRVARCALRAQDVIERRHPLAGGRANIIFIYAALRNKSDG